MYRVPVGSPGAEDIVKGCHRPVEIEGQLMKQYYPSRYPLGKHVLENSIDKTLFFIFVMDRMETV